MLYLYLHLYYNMFVRQSTLMMHKILEVENMTDAAREARNAYRRQWAAAHPDKVREWQRRYWEKKAQQAEAEALAQEADDIQEGGGRDA